MIARIAAGIASMQPMRLGILGFAYFLLAACAGPDAYTRFTGEVPPCRLPALTDQQVHDAVLKGRKSTQIAGLAEPIWRVTEVKCVYRYEQSAFYYKGQPVPLNTVDGDDIVMVARDLRTL